MSNRFLYPSLLLAASATTLLAAYTFQYAGGIEPCILCRYQRLPYWLAVGLGLAALAAARWPRLQGLLLGAVGLGFAVGAGIAGYHVGVEQQLVAGPQACSDAIGEAATLEELRAQILGRPVVRCDVVPWSLFGISLAGFNGFISLALAAGGLWAMRASYRRARP
jgi:disulfide bond formation protein DsbB